MNQTPTGTDLTLYCRLQLSRERRWKEHGKGMKGKKKYPK
jgi:hypothetical protein